MLQHTNSDCLSAAYLLRSLNSHQHQPHLLVDCSRVEIECVRFGLEQWAARPLTHCRLPGALRLPRDHRGTLFVEGLQFLNLTQQIALYDWLTAAGSSPQVICLASSALDALMAAGGFLECLYYRLNVVRLDLGAQDQPALERRS